MSRGDHRESNDILTSREEGGDKQKGTRNGISRLVSKYSYLVGETGS